MAYLLDTEIWIQSILGDSALPVPLQATIEKASLDGKLFLSIFSLWEAAEWENSGDLRLFMPRQKWLDQAVEQSRVQLLPLSPVVIVESTQLPGNSQGFDLVDKMLVATARIHNLSLITQLGRLVTYAREKHVKVAAIELFT